MKFTDLSPAKQQLLKAFTEGETIQVYTLADGWTEEYCTGFLNLIDIANLSYIRVKPKVTCSYTAINADGYLYSNSFSSLEDVMEYYSNTKMHSFVKRTFHDGVFIKAEIVQK